MSRPATSIGYRALARIADLALPLVAPLSSKLATGDRERRAALSRWLDWARSARDPGRPLLWIHAPSVGEGLQAQAVLQRLRPAHPEWQIVATFFSPSAASLAANQPVDRADYLPYDTAPNADRLLGALSPRALVFTKADLWPELATRARAGGAAVGIVAGTVSPVSGRRGWLSRVLTSAGYRAVSAAGAVAREDAEGLAFLGVPADRIEITGDPRFDSALARARAVPAGWPLHRLTRGTPTLVAGSTWAGDEAVLLAAFGRLRSAGVATRLVLVPHEPRADYLAALDQRIAATGRRATRLSALGDDEPGDLVVVDRVGVLAGLYREAAIGYVGGGFGSAGLHSVLEPAACGIPVVFGPRWQGSREAGLLLRAGAARALPAVGAAEAMTGWWRDWLTDPAARNEAGRHAAAVVEGSLGAAPRTAALIERMMETGPGLPPAA